MRILVVPVLVAVLAGLTAGAGEPEKKKEKETKEPDKQEVVTNETLKKKYGEAAPAEPPQEADKSEPLSKKVKSKLEPKPAMTEEERGKRIADLKTEQDRLKRRILSIKNPFLAKVPPTEAEKKAEKGKGAAERVRMLEERLARLGEELSKLEEPPGRTR